MPRVSDKIDHRETVREKESERKNERKSERKRNAEREEMKETKSFMMKETRVKKVLFSLRYRHIYFRLFVFASPEFTALSFTIISPISIISTRRFLFFIRFISFKFHCTLGRCDEQMGRFIWIHTTCTENFTAPHDIFVR